MRLLLPIVLIVALLAACRGGVTTVPSVTPTGAPTATPALQAPGLPGFATPVSAPVIDASNASRLHTTDSLKATAAQRLAWSNSGGALWVIGTRSVDAIDPNTATSRRVLDVPDPERVLTVLPTGVAIIATGAAAPVRLADVASGRTLRTLDPGGVVTAASSFRGNRLVLVSGDRIEASIWDVDSGQRVSMLSGFQTAAPVFNVVLSNDGARAAWVARGTLQFQDVASGAFGPRIQFEDFIGAYAFSNDGRAFATVTGVPAAGGAVAGRAQIWDPVTGAETARFEQLATMPTVVFAPLQPVVATGGDGFALWSAIDGKRLGGAGVSDAGHVRLVSFSPDGTLFITVDEESTIRLWRAR
jgi:WD40 repeat protein